jgi:hypothetical protein
MRRGGHVVITGDRTGAKRGLVERPEGNSSRGRPRRRWYDNIKINIQEVGWTDMKWIDLAQKGNRWLAFLNVVLNLRVPQNAGNF